jgi:hypothetical protein
MVTRTPQQAVLNVGNVTWTNMPAALTELFGLVHRRQRLTLVDVDAVRLVGRVSTAGAAAAVLRAEYSLNESTWATLTSDLSLAAVGTVASTWSALPAGAKGQDVIVRIVGVNGDGVADPVIGNLALEYR